MNNIVILCTPKFSTEEYEEIGRVAVKFGMTREKFIRQAVRFFCDQCVPTQMAEKVFSSDVCTYIRPTE